MAVRFQNRFRIDSARLPAWDYSSSGAYFITICTHSKRRSFGEIINDVIQLSEIGKTVSECWSSIPNHFDFISLDEFTIMPNHLHGIIKIEKPLGCFYRTGNPIDLETGHTLALQSHDTNALELPRHPRFRNQGKNTISAMVGSFKSAVTNWCNKNNFSFAWQSRFHDRIIRDKEEFYRIKTYIVNNPKNWKTDEYYSV